jgi:hypothetical protein
LEASTCPAAGRLAAQPLPRRPRRGRRALAERLGSVNAAAAELGTTWPSLRKAFTRHGLGMPARNPGALRKRAIDAARQRSGRPATPALDPVFVALNRDELPVRARSARATTLTAGSGGEGGPRVDHVGAIR